MCDADLLRRYVEDRSAEAFAELVTRHLDLVYSVARRQTGSTASAEDVAQSVFIELARRADRIKPTMPLVAWLHVVTRRMALNAVRDAARRQAREQTAAEIVALTSEPSLWSKIEPLLDEAVDSLNDSDRAAILLRYFEAKPLREIGAALGTSDDAAQKRVSRAIEQLRAFFVRRGVTVTATSLATDISAHALQAAPASLGVAISHSATLVSAGSAAAALATSRLVAMTALQKSLALAALVTVAGVGVYQTRLVARQTGEIAGIVAQNGRAAQKIADLRAARAAALAKLKEVDQRIDFRLAQSPPLSPSDVALEAQMQEWLTQITKIKEFLAQRPGWDIPELKLLTDQDWFAAAAQDRVESEEQLRRATAHLRDLAVSHASAKITNALNAYVRSHDGVLPDSALALAPYFDPPIDPAILGRYNMLRSGKLSDVPRDQLTRILESTPADVEYDAYTFVGINGYGNSGVAMTENVRQARQRYASANGGQRATDAEQLLPYLKWPVSLAVLEKYVPPSSVPRTP